MIIKYMKYFLLPFAVVSLNAGAQTYPVCQSPDSDPDGDFYGWENNGTCRVANPDTPPAIVRNDDGTTVNQTRAYWQDSDLIGKTITCRNHVFMPDPNVANAGSYVADPFAPEYSHGADGMVTQTVNGQFAGTTAWSITDGVYTGAAFMSQTRFIDADFNTNFSGDSRGWTSAAGFWQCDGAAPTGTAPPKPPAVCEDTPPVGDGWGWDGTNSCQIDTKPPTLSSKITLTLEEEYLTDPAAFDELVSLESVCANGETILGGGCGGPLATSGYVIIDNRPVTSNRWYCLWHCTKPEGCSAGWEIQISRNCLAD
ncbi:hypothetical protein AB833_08130 [Chromatiales bacterium (ex Bugula neritina AB1)]|nr:hypothetical protein AB833_08130 [Chromatiales bacterium (ex Bugula neritina AB1)]